MLHWCATEVYFMVCHTIATGVPPVWYGCKCAARECKTPVAHQCNIYLCIAMPWVCHIRKQNLCHRCATCVQHRCGTPECKTCVAHQWNIYQCNCATLESKICITQLCITGVPHVCNTGVGHQNVRHMWHTSGTFTCAIVPQTYHTRK